MQSGPFARVAALPCSGMYPGFRVLAGASACIDSRHIRRNGTVGPQKTHARSFKTSKTGEKHVHLRADVHGYGRMSFDLTTPSSDLAEAVLSGAFGPPPMKAGARSYGMQASGLVWARERKRWLGGSDILVATYCGVGAAMCLLR